MSFNKYVAFCCKKKEGKKLIKEDYDVSNIYKLDGRVPVSKAIPFGLQHVLAMFVSNVTPIILISVLHFIMEIVFLLLI